MAMAMGDRMAMKKKPITHGHEKKDHDVSVRNKTTSPFSP